MREILFRGKRIKDGKWVEGVYFPQNDTWPAAIFTGERRSVGEYVESDTVGQYTGLTDKNGKKIFEGDLLKGFEYPFYRSESDEHNYFAEVIWFPGNCAFGLYTHKYPTAKVRGISAGNADFIEDFNSDDWEVIGNIHDNPDLLKGGTR